MKNWICRDWTCGHIVVAEEKPNPMKWDDGHICYFIKEKETEDGESDICEEGTEG